MIRSKIHMQIDISKFKDRTFKTITDALYNVGAELVNDVDFGENAVMIPIDEGVLTGSSAIAVKDENQISLTAPKSPKATQPDLSGMESMSVRVSYNTAYASRIHEEYKNMRPGIGSQQKFGIDSSDRQERYGYKFLERTYKMNQSKYQKLFEEIMTDGLM